MQQLEIELFFPLTEQIPLDLDYSECDAGFTAPLISAYQAMSLALSNISEK